MNRIMILLACAALSLPHVATAATPKLSGTYILAYNEICQAYNFLNQGGYNGAAYRMILSGTFDDATKQINLTGSNFSGSLLSFQSGGTPFTEQPVTFGGSYNNTNTTLTIPAGISGNINLSIVYGVVKKGIAQSADIAGVPPDDSSTCAVSGTLTRKGN